MRELKRKKEDYFSQGFTAEGAAEGSQSAENFADQRRSAMNEQSERNDKERAASEELQYELQGQGLRAQVPLSATPPREDDDGKDEDMAEMAQQVSSLMKTSENQEGGYAPIYTQEALAEQNDDPRGKLIYEFQETDSASEGLANNNNEHAYNHDKVLNADQM